jgi:Leucine-rich repeat (LRR) protein
MKRSGVLNFIVETECTEQQAERPFHPFCPELPPSIGRLSKCEALYLFGNKLRSLPQQITLMTSLKFLQLGYRWPRVKGSKLGQSLFPP